MQKLRYSFLVILFSITAYGQQDTLSVSPSASALPSVPDTLRNITKSDTPKNSLIRQALYLSPVTPEKKPGVVFIRSVVPGLGQISNGQTWKAPIVWTAATGAIVTIRYWGSRFKGYRDIIVASDAAGNTSSTFLPAKGLLDGGLNIGFKQNLDATEVTIDNTRFKTVIERYRRYRDLTVIGFAVGYFIVGVEAYVSAHLKGFDFSDDISLQIKPTLRPSPLYGGVYGVSAQLSFR